MSHSTPPMRLPLARPNDGRREAGGNNGHHGLIGVVSTECCTDGILVDTNAVAPTTWHSLGGACMGTACDLDGRVREQRGLYVLDGALIPGNTGACNPSMTIAAVAERAMDNIVMHDMSSVI